MGSINCGKKIRTVECSVVAEVLVETGFMGFGGTTPGIGTGFGSTENKNIFSYINCVWLLSSLTLTIFNSIYLDIIEMNGQVNVCVGYSR